jgi:hypothetical protein
MKNVTRGGGGGTEMCQKSVTYYLNDPLPEVIVDDVDYAVAAKIILKLLT